MDNYPKLNFGNVETPSKYCETDIYRLTESEFVDIVENSPCPSYENPVCLEDDFNPDHEADLIANNEAHPVCFDCKTMFNTFQGYEYHILRHHVQYRPFRCLTCGTSEFHTEKEGLYHIKTQHANIKSMPLVKHTDFNKEAILSDICKQTKYLIPNNKNSSNSKFSIDISIASKVQLQKFGRCRFAVPECFRSELDLKEHPKNFKNSNSEFKEDLETPKKTRINTVDESYYYIKKCNDELDLAQ